MTGERAPRHPGPAVRRQPPRPVRRPLCGAHGRHEGLRDPRAVRGGLPARGRLAGRRDAVPQRAAPRRDRRRRRPAGPRARHRRRCSTAPARATRRCASRSLEASTLVGVRCHPDDVVVTVGSQHGARPRHPDLLRPRRRRARRVARRTSGRWAPSRRTSARSSTSPWTTRGWCRRRCARPWRRAGRRGPHPQVPLHDPVVPQPGRRLAGAAAPPRDPGHRAVGRPAGARGRPVRPARLRRQHPAGAAGRRRRGRHLPRARSRRPSRPGCGSATR